MNAVKYLAGFDEENETYRIPTLALKLGTSLKKCAKIVKAQALLKGDISKKKKDADDFYELCEIEWNDTVSATSLKTLKEKKIE